MSAFNTLWVNSAANNSVILFFLFFRENRIRHSYKLSPKDTFYMKCRAIYSWKIRKKSISKCLLLAGILTCTLCVMIDQSLFSWRNIDWLQCPVATDFFLIILFDNLLRYNQHNKSWLLETRKISIFFGWKKGLIWNCG